MDIPMPRAPWPGELGYVSPEEGRRNLVKSLRARLGREPTQAEVLAAATGISDETRDILRRTERFIAPAVKV